jgi:hypothetical protein
VGVERVSPSNSHHIVSFGGGKISHKKGQDFTQKKGQDFTQKKC